MVCFTCGKPVAHLWNDYVSSTKGKTPTEISQTLDRLGLRRYCCRRTLMCTLDCSDIVT
ncbi:MAG: hypothetical protein ACYCOU_05225 [Sulfobacillus sp.]